MIVEATRQLGLFQSCGDVLVRHLVQTGLNQIVFLSNN